MMKNLALLGARLWEHHGFWIDEEQRIVQTNYDRLPLLGKIGYNLMMYGLKRKKKIKSEN